MSQVNEHLHALEPLLQTIYAVNGEELSLDDFHLFAELRNMTLFKDIELPGKVLEYTQNISYLSQVPLLMEKSL